MLFKPEHKEMILAGKKTATRRVWKKSRVKVGGVYKAKLKLMSKDYFAKIKVTKLFKQRLGNMTLKDCIKEGYDTKTEFIDIWVKINGPWREDLVIDVIEFEVLNNSKNKEVKEIIDYRRRCISCGKRCYGKRCWDCHSKGRKNTEAKRKGNRRYDETRER